MGQLKRYESLGGAVLNERACEEQSAIRNGLDGGTSDIKELSKDRQRRGETVGREVIRPLRPPNPAMLAS